LKKAQVESLLRRAELGSEFANSKLSKPIALKPMTDWKSSLLACQVMMYKTDLYHAVREKYPTGENWDDFISQLSEVIPKTTSVDKTFNREDVKLTNKDSKITFECKDPTGDKTYSYNYYDL
jgi:hypothetical protein